MNFSRNELVPKRLDCCTSWFPGPLYRRAARSKHAGVRRSPLQDVRSGRRALGRQLLVVKAAPAEIEAAFAASCAARGALFVSGTHSSAPDASNRRAGGPPCGSRDLSSREYVEAGGLISYGQLLADAYRQVGVYAGRILKGAKPADLPVMQSTKFELVINLKTAKALGLEVPPTLLARADEVIE